MAGADEPADEGRALEYVLGTLSADERRSFEEAMRADPELEALVRSWEGTLASLTHPVVPVEPSPDLWSRIAGAIDRSGGTVLPFPTRDVEFLRRARSRWRATAIAAGAIAAALAAFVAIERLPPGRTEPALLAVVNRDGNLPALVVRVDTRTRTVQVRSLAAETPPDRSLELWSVAGEAAPRSLGLVPAGSGRLPVPNGAVVPEGGTLAVSVEPRGGSPTGAPTGPVVYSGRLVPDGP